MSVAPVPVMPADPTLPDPASADSGTPAPGFADALAAAQGDEHAPGGLPPKPKTEGDNPAELADIVALLAALTGAPPAAETPAVPDVPIAPASTTVWTVAVGLPTETAQTLPTTTAVQADAITASVLDAQVAPATEPGAAPADAVPAPSPPPTPAAPTTPAPPTGTDAPPPADAPDAPDAPIVTATTPAPDAAPRAHANGGAALAEHSNPAAVVVGPQATGNGVAVGAARRRGRGHGAGRTRDADAPPAPAPPADQLFSAMRPLQRASDGSYHLRMEMRPPELGRVDVRVELRDGVLHATIRTEHAGTAELVRGALDDLRARLEGDGVRAGELTVDDNGARQRQRDERAAPETRDEVPTPTATAAAAEPYVPNADNSLDVRI